MESEGQPSRGDCFGSNDTERKVAQLRAIVEEQDPAAKELDNLTLRRFLLARDLDVRKASTFLLKHLKWRQSMVPNGFILEAEIQYELSQKKAFAQGFDKMGRPIAVIINARHNASKRNMHEFKRFVVYVMDKLCARMAGGQEKFCIIGDFQGFGFSNCDIQGFFAALEIFQNNYPERLGKALMIHVPYIFMKAWKIIYPFIDSNTKNKYVFVDEKNTKDKLLEEIHESQLPEIYGGKLPLIPIEQSI
ncbi:phosphatidylinositol transfer protein 3-like [Phoenix dactylifera]|uniref:Phosphatidylinositol transfer protein 3-like n=1 Tax=Phoenix dactylifera TaxID=42345 RepID=A0A8B9ARG5_PHODC|nr:phosphatidylinositol transfer protein 3-like [Phoenix dactylifera]